MSNNNAGDGNSDRRQTDAAFIRSVIDNLPQIVVYQIVAEAGGGRHFTYLSGGVTDIFGCTPEEAVADPMRIYGKFADEDRERVAQEEEATLKALMPFRSEFRVKTDGGSERWVSAASRPCRQANGDVIWDGIIIEITERKRIEKALRNSEEQFRMVVENSRDGIHVYDLESDRYIFASPAQIAWSGFSAEEIRNFTQDYPYQRVHPEDLEVTAKIRHDIAERRELIGPVEYRWKTKSGEYRWISDSRKLVRDAQGQPVAYVGLHRDVTERKRMEEELRDAKQRLESLLENSPLAVIEWSSTDFRIVRWSGGATRFFGWTAEEAIGQQVTDLNLVHPEDQTVINELMRDVLSGKQTRNVTRNRNLRKDGTVVYCEWYNSVLAERGERLSVLSLVLDVTDQKLAEKELREVNERLRDADRAKNDFLAMLSHELRNPLTPIKNSLYILNRAPTGGEQAKRANEVIGRQVEHLSRLVDDLLDVTRISRNKVHLQRSRIDLNELVYRTVEDHRSLFERSGVMLESSLAAGRVFVDADEARMVQVVGNLLQNAAKFAGQAGRTRVSVHVDAATNRAVLRVYDTGVGIEPKLLPRLFEPFMQADIGLDRAKGGLGLGLALVKGLVELHGGEVTVRSEGAGKGAEFIVTLPLLLPNGPKERPDANPNVQPAAAGRRILVIEDNVDVADSLREVLQFGGHQVLVAYNGPDGITKARDFKPELVLCDIGLPGMDGYEVARTLRADEALKGASLVALSGYALPEDVQRAKDAGFGQHIAKPIGLERLEQIIASLPPRQ